jgi:hypothetical protein
MTLMEEQIFTKAGIHNTAETKRKAKTLAKRDEQSKSNDGGFSRNASNASPSARRSSSASCETIWTPRSSGRRPWTISPKSTPAYDTDLGHRWEQFEVTD